MTRDEIDVMWQQALHQSVQDGEQFTRYRFAALVAANALELADKRIAELECILAGQQALGYLPKGIVTGTVYGLTVDELYQKIVQADEAGRNLAVAREALKDAHAAMLEFDIQQGGDTFGDDCRAAEEALAQIGGEDAG